MVSDLGNVMSVPRTVRESNGKEVRFSGVRLETSCSGGYKMVSLSGRKKRVHRLVAKAFVTNPDNKPAVNHKDGDKTNNSAKNLEWCTHSENLAHAYNHGLRSKPYKNKYHAEFSDEQVRSIRADKRTPASIAADYGVTDTCIRNIKNHKTYKEVI